jgi:hypothetical protein
MRLPIVLRIDLLHRTAGRKITMLFSLGALMSGYGCAGILSGGDPPKPNVVAATPQALNFGNVAVGSAAALNVLVTNTAAQNVTVSIAKVVGTGFTLEGLSSPLNIAAGSSIPVNVVFSPQTTGAAAGTLEFAASPSSSPMSVSLSGNGFVPLSHSVDVSWMPSTSSNVVGYNAYRSNQSGGPYMRLNPALLPSTSYTDLLVQSGENLFYVVTAVDANGNESIFSEEVTAAVPIP